MNEAVLSLMKVKVGLRERAKKILIWTELDLPFPCQLIAQGGTVT